MKKAKTVISVTLATMYLVILLLPITGSFAVREMDTDPSALNRSQRFSRPSTNYFRSPGKEFGVDSMMGIIGSKGRVGYSYSSVEELITFADAFDDVSDHEEQSEYSYYGVWNDLELQDKTLKRVSFRTAAIAISSTRQKEINISAMALSAANASKIGISSLKLQRYRNGRWMTIYGVSDSYNYSASTYFFTTIRKSLTSRDYYRVVVTFSAANGNAVTTITRYTTCIRCR